MDRDRFKTPSNQAEAPKQPRKPHVVDSVSGGLKSAAKPKPIEAPKPTAKQPVPAVSTRHAAKLKPQPEVKRDIPREAVTETESVGTTDTKQPRRFRLPEVSLPQSINKKIAIPAAVIAAVLVIGAGLFAITGGFGTNKQTPVATRTARESTTINRLSTTGNSSAVKAPSTSNQPTYKPVVPASQPGLATDTTNMKYDKNNDSYSFIDNYLGSSLLVVEHAPPVNSKTLIEQLAQAVGDTHSVVTASGTAYVSNQAANSYQQTVIAPAKNLIITIQSTAPRSDAEWKSYLESLI